MIPGPIPAHDSRVPARRAGVRPLQPGRAVPRSVQMACGAGQAGGLVQLRKHRFGAHRGQHLDHRLEGLGEVREQAALAAWRAVGGAGVGAAAEIDVVARVQPSAQGQFREQSGDQQAAITHVAQGIRTARRFLRLQPFDRHHPGAESGITGMAGKGEHQITFDFLAKRQMDALGALQDQILPEMGAAASEDPGHRALRKWPRFNIAAKPHWTKSALSAIGCQTWVAHHQDEVGGDRGGSRRDACLRVFFPSRVVRATFRNLHPGPSEIATWRRNSSLRAIKRTIVILSPDCYSFLKLINSLLPTRSWMQASARLVPTVMCACLGLWVGSGLIGCSPHDPPITEPLEAVERPPDLHGLDRSVRRQFELIWTSGIAASDAHSTGAAKPGRGEWGKLGQWFHAYRYDDSAARSYRNAIRTDPQDPRWPYLLGVLLSETGAPEDALAYFEQARLLAPEAPHVLGRLADVALAGAELDQAEALYRDVLRVEPADPSARFGLGRVALQRGDARAALAWLEPLSNEQPEAAEVLYALGQAWRMSGNVEQSAHLLGKIPEKNLEQVPLARNDPWMKELTASDQGSRALTRRGIQAAGRGRAGEAAVLFGAAVRRDPDGPEERINYALALDRIGRRKEALEQLTKATELAPDGSDIEAKARLERGRLLARSRRAGQAIGVLRSLASDRPLDAPVHVELSRLLHSSGDFTGAIAEYEVLRGMKKSGPEVAFWHACALMSLGQIEAAVNLLDSDIRQHADSDLLRLLWIRGVAVGASARPALAQSAFELLATLQRPIDVFHAETAAMLHAGLGDFPAAESWQLGAVQALSEAGAARALSTARRRLALYAEHKKLRAPLELGERPLDIPVRTPTPGG